MWERHVVYIRPLYNIARLAESFRSWLALLRMSTDVLAGYIDEGASYIYAGNDIGSVCVYTVLYRVYWIVFLFFLFRVCIGPSYIVWTATCCLVYFVFFFLHSLEILRSSIYEESLILHSLHGSRSKRMESWAANTRLAGHVEEVKNRHMGII
jgi:hypothetical protein